MKKEFKTIKRKRYAGKIEETTKGYQSAISQIMDSLSDIEDLTNRKITEPKNKVAERVLDDLLEQELANMNLVEWIVESWEALNIKYKDLD